MLSKNKGKKMVMWFILIIALCCLSCTHVICPESPEYPKPEIQVPAEQVLPKYFNNINELQDWLVQDNTNEITFIPQTFDCEDFALMLQENAFEDGYLLSIYPHYTINGQYHVGCLVVVGDELWYIEPQNDTIEVFIGLD